jgi:DNA-directed RNA polymerase specialized sigma subunit
MPFVDDYLEDELKEPYQAWKASGGTPEANAAILGQLEPTIHKAVTTHVGQSNPLIFSRARRMALDAVRTYDPKRARLQTHLFNQLQGLKRASRQQTTILKVPERVALDRYHLGNYTQELIDKLGREPSDEELADHSGFSLKRIARVRSYHPAVAEGTLEAASPTHEVLGGVTGPRHERLSMAQQIVYGDLSPTDKLIMEHALGLHGRRPLQNQEIAAKLGRSPGLISQRKKVIQGMIDQVHGLGEF